MEAPLVITVSRQYGSGGREVAERLASDLGFAYYDKLLLARIAEESGMDADVIDRHDEKPMSSHFFNLGVFGGDEHPVSTHIRQTEVRILHEIAEEGPCVIVGRGADDILSDHPNLVRVFVSAPLEARVARVMRHNGLDDAEARARIARVDKQRAGYYRFHSDGEWGKAHAYDLCLNTGNVNVEGAVRVIRCFLDAREIDAGAPAAS